MLQANAEEFCTECRKPVSYHLQKKTVTRCIHGKEHTFQLTEAVCDECGSEMNLPGLLDTNALETDEQYRSAEHILSVREIKTLMRLYNLGKAPLSLAMGFGEVTIARYLEGQIPSQEYSDRMRKALASPDFMKSLLEENRDKLKPAAWRKGMESVRQLEGIASLSPPLRQSIAEVLSRLGEVTPLLMQKLLYYIQGLSLALHDQPVFPEPCQAWIHGPVYPGVYQVFRYFSFNPIDDDRFAILRETENTLTEEQKALIHLVTDTFGLYGGKVLESVTHSEDPWITARSGCPADTPSSTELSQQDMKDSFLRLGTRYDLRSVEGLHQYIQDAAFCLFHPIQ